MSDTDWQRAQQIFEKAAKLPPTERAAFLAGSCGDDAVLKAEVESLLAHHEQASSDFLHPPDETRTLDTASAAADPTSPLRLEGYEITRELSRGGQGVVYQAIEKPVDR